ncbi:hypothetical protein ACVW2K_000316 [Nocardioides sp. HB32]
MVDPTVANATTSETTAGTNAEQRHDLLDRFDVPDGALGPGVAGVLGMAAAAGRLPVVPTWPSRTVTCFIGSFPSSLPMGSLSAGSWSDAAVTGHDASQANVNSWSSSKREIGFEYRFSGAG